MRSQVVFLVCILFALIFPGTGLGQDEGAPIRVETDLVSINVAVIDGLGKPVTGLSREQFEIYDNRVKQEIENFSGETAGVTFGIVYDMHPTTDVRTNSVLNGLREFTKSLGAEDDYFFVVFNERGSLSLDFVPDRDQLQRHLAYPPKREPRSLYDALFLAAEKLRTERNAKKTLVVITDAADHNSRRSFDDLREQLRRLDVQVYAIVLDEKLDRFTSYVDITKDPSRAQALSDATPTERAALNSIALRTGGATFPSSFEDQQSILRISKQIAGEMQRQYTFSFYPSRASDGTWHSLGVRLRGVRDSKKFVLTYRQGYQSPPAAKRP